VLVLMWSRSLFVGELELSGADLRVIEDIALIASVVSCVRAAD
jgi:hypothetical protein